MLVFPLQGLPWNHRSDEQWFSADRRFRIAALEAPLRSKYDKKTVVCCFGSVRSPASFQEMCCWKINFGQGTSVSWCFSLTTPCRFFWKPSQIICAYIHFIGVGAGKFLGVRRIFARKVFEPLFVRILFSWRPFLFVKTFRDFAKVSQIFPGFSPNQNFWECAFTLYTPAFLGWSEKYYFSKSKKV